jgi:hypothetical protein
MVARLGQRRLYGCNRRARGTPGGHVPCDRIPPLDPHRRLDRARLRDARYRRRSAAPQIELFSPADGDVFYQGQQVQAAWGCFPGTVGWPS